MMFCVNTTTTRASIFNRTARPRSPCTICLSSRRKCTALPGFRISSEDRGSRRTSVITSVAMNIAEAVRKSYESKSLLEIADAPVSALEGIAEKREKALNELRIVTVRDLATWKYYRIAKSIVALASTEVEGGRLEGASMNIDKALDKAYEGASFSSILSAPPSALQGLTKEHDAILKQLQIKDIKALGSCKWAVRSEAIVNLADFHEE
uniref:Uncharacterized protein n=1 Tax=Tetraselmis sp. GSL018 TaxID=582737 RepID=A0A061R4P1_9CHLO